MLRLILVAALAMSMVASFVSPARAFTNDCRGWATALGIQGVVSGSIRMHMLGCDDRNGVSGAANGYYHIDDGLCAHDARVFARAGYWNRPRTVAALVEAKDHCTVFEDGTYAPPLY